jgi:Tfp pilus assembly protein PilZ
MTSSTVDDNDTPVADSRQNLRAPLIVQKIHLDTERSVFFGYSKNISRSGVFIATTNPINQGEQIDLEIPLPPPINGTVRCRCEVVWRRPLGKHLPHEPGIGVKFIDLPDQISQQLDDLIKSKLED